MPTLPLELLYEVFHEDGGTILLKKAALVCKALQRHAQELLFKDYRMDNGRDQDYKIKPIFSSPHLLQHVRIIRLESPHWAHKTNEWHYWNIGTAVKVLRQLPMEKITGVDLCGPAFDQAQKEPTAPGYQEFIELITQLCSAPNLCTVSLSGQESRLLPLCGSSVKELTLRDTGKKRQEGMPPVTRREPMVLNSLSVLDGLSPGHNSLSFILEPESMISIDSLQVFSVVLRGRSPSSTQKVLNRSKKSLTRLDLGFTYTGNLATLGLGQLEALKLINIEASFPCDDEPDIIPWLYKEFCNASESPLPLEEMFIYFEVDDFEIPRLDTSLWAPLASLLANRDALPKLLSFTLKIRGTLHDRPRVIKEACTAFQGLGEPQILARRDREGVQMLRIDWFIVAEMTA